jgi:cytochrome c oxidase subunit II
MVHRIIATALAAMLWSSMASSASSLQSELDDVLRQQPDLDAGERIYTAACTACHGVAGQGQADGLAPRLAGQHFSVIANQLVGYRLGRRMDDRMQARASDHVLRGSQDMANVAAYAAQLPGGKVAQGSGRQVERGAQLFANRCSSCHGVRAEGSERNVVPRLAAQNHRYLLRQLRDLIDGRRAAAGRDHVQPMKSLEPDQVDALADYLSRLP